MIGDATPGGGSGRELRAHTAMSSKARSSRSSGVLPSLNDDGDLPPGIHSAGWTEIEARFGKGTAARERAFATLKTVHELATRTGSLRSFYVFGSFVSAATEPRDVDVFLVMAADFRVEDGPAQSEALFSHANAQGRYRASIFWLREGTVSRDTLRELCDGWQIKRSGALRGILEIA